MAVQTSFNAGELSPQVYGRPDLAKYVNGCRKLRNFICLSHGPATRRPGTVFVSAVKDQSKKVRLLNYKYSVEQAYILEMGDLYARHHTDGFKINDKSMVITGITQANPCVVSYTGDVPDDGDLVTLSQIFGMTELNILTQFTIANKTGATFELSGVDSTTYTAYTSGGVAEVYYEITTPYTEAQLPDLDWSSSFDTIYIAHPDHERATLVRSGHADWSLDDLICDCGPYFRENTTSTTLDPDGSSGNVTITASAVTGINDDQGFLSTDVGRLIKYHDGTDYHNLRITAVNSTTEVEADILGDGTTHAHGLTTLWSLGAWCETTGWPRTVSFDNSDRLYWAGSKHQPQTLWGSVQGLYNQHSTSDPLVDSDAINLTMGSKEANAIQWLALGSKFAVGTTGSEHWLTSANGAGAMTPTSKSSPVGSHDGCSSVKPIMAAARMLFLMTHQKILKELKYSYAADAFEGDELTIIAEHLTKNNKIIDMAFQREPYRVVWCVRDDGKILGLTYYPEHEVYGWHMHPLGGNGIAESVAVIPGENEDEVWLAVKRTINGSTARYIERMHETFTPADDGEDDGGFTEDVTDAFFVDCGISLDNRQDIESITHADPGVINLTDHGYSDGNSITIRSKADEIDGEGSLDSLNNERFEVAHKTANTFQLHDVDGNDVDLTAYKQVVSATVAENVTTISGLQHLEGEDVKVLADGQHADKTVSNASITLDSSASVIHVGLGFTSELETFPPERVDTQTQQLGKIKRITNVIIQLHKTLGMKIRNRKRTWERDYEFSSDDVPHGQPASLFTGFTDDISFDDGQQREPTVVIVQDEPLPMTVLAIHQTTEEEDD